MPPVFLFPVVDFLPVVVCMLASVVVTGTANHLPVNLIIICGNLCILRFELKFHSHTLSLINYEPRCLLTR